MNNERNAPGSHCSAVDCLWHHHQNDADAANAAAANAAGADHENMIKKREERRKNRQGKKNVKNATPQKEEKRKRKKMGHEKTVLCILYLICVLCHCVNMDIIAEVDH